MDISKAGLYKNVQSFDFAILLFAYSVDGGPVQIVDLAQGEEIPPDIIAALGDINVTKYAYNAAFEQYCLSKYYTPPIYQWRCTMVQGLYCGYPAELSAIGEALGLSEDKRKLTTGKALIRYFCVPCKPTKTNGGRTRNLPHHEPEKWEEEQTRLPVDSLNKAGLQQIIDTCAFVCFKRPKVGVLRPEATNSRPKMECFNSLDIFG